MSDFHDHHGDPDYERDRGYEWEGYRPAPPRPRRGLFSLLIVIAAVGAFCLLIWFVYTQGRRAGTEVVAPVIHADAGPTKVKPESPGGMDVPNQDRLIYERLRNDKDGGDGVEHLLPPPETPMDRPQAPPPAPAQTARADDEEAPPAPAVGAPATGAPAAPSSAAPVTARPDAAPAQAVPAPAPAPAPAPTPAPAPARVASAPVPLPPSSAPRPASPRPEVAKAEAPKVETPRPAPAPAPQVLTPPASPAPQAASAPPGGGGALRLQFASVPSDTQAVAEAQRIQRKHAAVLGGVALHIVRADLGAKGIYYRVQAGPLDEAQARRLCDAVKAGGDNCIPVH